MTSTASVRTPKGHGSGPMRAGHELSILRDSASRPGRLSETDTAWPGRLRRITRAALNHWGCSGTAATAELLATELVTNAFQHGTGPEVGFRVRLGDKHLVIEVFDGSSQRPQPRPAGPDEENGRGLLIVESLAESWGVSDDGTTTWCTIPLTEGPPHMDPVAVTAPVLRAMPLNQPTDRVTSSKEESA